MAVSIGKKGTLAMERQRRARMYRRAKNLLRDAKKSSGMCNPHMLGPAWHMHTVEGSGVGWRRGWQRRRGGTRAKERADGLGKEDLSLGAGKLSHGEMGELLTLKVRERSGMC